MGRHKTGGGVGTNQYQVRGQSKTGAVSISPAIQAGPQKIRCGELWGTTCSSWVRSPNWSHGKHPSSISMDQAATNEDTPPSVLAALSRSALPYIRKAVIRNPATPLTTLRQLAYDVNDHVRTALLTNPNTTADILHTILEQVPARLIGPYERKHLVTHPQADAEILDGLVCDPDVHKQVLAARHPNFSRRAEKMIEDPRRYGDHLAEISSHPYPVFRALVADNAQTRSQDLLKLATDPDVLVRTTTAKNRNLPAAGAEILADDCLDVRVALAANPSLSPDILEKLSRCYAQGRPDTAATRSTLHRMLVRHPNLPGPILAGMASSTDSWVYRAALRHPNCPMATLMQTIDDPRWDRRVAIATNPACPPELLTRLLNDTSSQVRAAAIQNPNVPSHIRSILVLGHNS